MYASITTTALTRLSRRHPERKAATDGKSARSGTLHVHLSWPWGIQVGLKEAYDSVKAFSKIDMTEDSNPSSCLL